MERTLREISVRIQHLAPGARLGSRAGVVPHRSRDWGLPIDTLASPRPLVTVTYAQTLDGRLATRSGNSQWISGGDSLRVTHQMRADHDAIMVGIGTVLRDNPRLTVRLVEGHDPLRVVVDSRLRLPLDARVLADGAAGGTLVATCAHVSPVRCQAIRALGATVLALPARDGQVDLPRLLGELDRRGVRSVMVEGGARLITGLFRLRLVDRVMICVAPKILGAGIEAIGDLGIDDLDTAIRLTAVRVSPSGQDLLIEGDVRYTARGNDA